MSRIAEHRISLRSWAEMLTDVLDYELEREQSGIRFSSNPQLVEDLNRHLHNVIDEVIADYMYRRNERHARTECLPVELLPAIFLHLSEKDRITARHVCQRWRLAALSAPVLWLNVYSHDQRPGILSARLSCIPMTSPLRLELKINSLRLIEVVSVIQSRLPYIESLWLWVQKDIDDTGFLSLLGALSQPALSLSRFCIAFGDRNISWSDYPLLAGYAPHLDSLKIFGTLEGLSGLPFLLNLRTVKLGEPTTYSCSSIRGVLDLFSSAETLSVSLWDWDDSGCSLDKRATLPTKLRGLCITAAYGSIDLGNVVSHIPHGDLSAFTIKYDAEPTLDDTTHHELLVAVAQAIGKPVVRIAIIRLLNTVDLFVVLMWTEGFSCHRCFIRVRTSLHRVVQSFGNLTQLSIHENGLPEGECVYDLPFVRHLFIGLLDESFADALGSLGHDSLFLLPRTRDILFVCPALVEVSFISERLQAYLSPGLIADFITWHVECHNRVVIGLRHAEIIESNLEDVLALLPLIDGCAIYTDEVVRRELAARTYPDMSDLYQWDLPEN